MEWLSEHWRLIPWPVLAGLIGWIGRRRIAGAGTWIGRTLAARKNLAVCETERDYLERAYRDLVEIAELAQQADRRRWGMMKAERETEKEEPKQ